MCDPGFSCVEGACEQAATSTCVPNCAGKSCGSDGCAGLCGQCPAGQACDVDGHCATSGGGWSEPVGGTFSACEPGEIYNELTQDCVLDDGGEGGCGGAPVGHGLWTLLIGAWALTRRRRRA